MDNNENENGFFANLSPEAAMLNAVEATRHRFMEIEFEEFNEVEPDDVMALMVGVINILNLGTKCADRAKADTMDAFVYLQTAFCGHEGLANHIRDWNPDESTFVADEAAKKIFSSINEIRPLFIETFDRCHNRFHDEKVIDVQSYEKDINKLMMALGRIEGVKAQISGESASSLLYKNITNEDALAVMKMAADQEMEELHDFEVAQAVASYINSELPEGKSVKDLDDFDMMNACLGYKIIDMNKGEEELRKFVEDCVDRNQEVPPKCETKNGNGPNKMFAKVPAYQLSGNRMLVFEPEGFSSDIPKEAAEMIGAKVNEKVMRGMAFLMELTPKDKVPQFLIDVVTGKQEFDDSRAEEARQSLISWLGPWAGSPVTLEIKEEGKEDKKTVTVYEGSHLFGAIDGFFNSEKGSKTGFCSFPVELACVLGCVWKEGPEKFVKDFLTRSISLEDAIDGGHYFKSALKDHDFDVEIDNKSRMVIVRRK